MYKTLGIIFMTIGIIIPVGAGETLPAFFSNDIIFLSSLVSFLILAIFMQVKMKNDNSQTIERANSKVPNFL